MLFQIQDLSFSLGGALLLEGLPAFAARCACAVLLALAGWLVSRWLSRWLFPRLLHIHWPSRAVSILLGSFVRPAAYAALLTGLYLGLVSLPWGTVPARPLFLTLYRFFLHPAAELGPVRRLRADQPAAHHLPG